MLSRTKILQSSIDFVHPVKVPGVNGTGQSYRWWLPPWNIFRFAASYVYDFEWDEASGKVCSRHNSQSKWVNKCNGLGSVPKTQAPWAKNCSLCCCISDMALSLWICKSGEGYEEALHTSWHISWQHHFSKTRKATVSRFLSEWEREEAPPNWTASENSKRRGPSRKRGHNLCSWTFILNILFSSSSENAKNLLSLNARRSITLEFLFST